MSVVELAVELEVVKLFDVELAELDLLEVDV